MRRIAIVGGGPGGLVTAHYLDEVLAHPFTATIFEASSRVGGKICTRAFNKGKVLYEAGVAELYNYSAQGLDPLRELVDEFKLSTVEMAGPAVVLGDKIIRSPQDFAAAFGPKAAACLDEFYALAESQISPQDYFDDDWQSDNAHPWAKQSLRSVMDAVADDTVRHYVETAIRSDVASEPHLTNALNGLKNIVMEDPRYMTVYSIVGGIERLVTKLKKSISADIRLSTTVTAARQNRSGTWTLTTRSAGRTEEQEFDLVIFALPNYWLSRIRWGSRDLRIAMQRHLAYYDRPAHYLRVTALFQRPFWRDAIPGSYFMQDVFGGCCVYDESARHPAGDQGVLSWLISGTDAVAMSNLDDATLIEQALDSLPASIAQHRGLFVKGKVYRWLGAINALPGGYPIHDIHLRHQPDATGHPNLFVVGDYLFDSTLNGVVDSAEYVTDYLQARFATKPAVSPVLVRKRHLAVEPVT